MNGAQLHLAINHLPIVTSILALLLLLWAGRCRSAELKRTALAFVVLGGIFAAAAYFTGEPAEDVIEKLPIFSKDLVHEHEEAAEWAFALSAFAAVLAAFGLFIRRNERLARYAYIFVTLLTLLNCASFLRTAHLGGLIHHEEIRPAQAPTQ